MRHSPGLAVVLCLIMIRGAEATSQTSGTWNAMGTGLNNAAYALATSGSSVYVGGFFTDAGGITCNGIARWDGMGGWHALGAGLIGPNPHGAYAIAADSPAVYAGGKFTAAGTVSTRNIALWNGTAWLGLAGGVSGVGGNDYVKAVAIAGGHVYVAGRFSTAGSTPARNIARWNGVSWEALGAGVNNDVECLLVVGDTLYAGGWFDSAGVDQARHIARWVGSQWDSVSGGMDGVVNALAKYQGRLYAGGLFSQAGSTPAAGIARLDGSTWSAVGSGTNNPIYAMASSASGLFVGGLFTLIDGQPANFTAKWNGSQWSTLGGGVNNIVYAMTASGTSLYAGGIFQIAGTVAASRVARWEDLGVSALAMLTGWNLVSVPRKVTDFSAGALFPGRLDGPYAYNMSVEDFEPAPVLANGPGYFVLYEIPRVVNTQGTSLDSITVAVSRAGAGWVIIGSLTNPALASSIRTNVPGAILDGPYGYDPTTNDVFRASLLEPGRGYWMLMNGPCTIRVP